MQELIDRVHRESAGVLTSALTRLLTPAHLDRVESLVHDAFAVLDRRRAG